MKILNDYIILATLTMSLSYQEFVAARDRRTATNKHFIRIARGNAPFAEAMHLAEAVAAAEAGEELITLTVVCGLQHGDEGKGKILAAAIRGNPDEMLPRCSLVYRFGGGPNAGHCTHMPRDSPDLAIGPNFNVTGYDEAAGHGMIKLPTHQIPTGILFAAEIGPGSHLHPHSGENVGRKPISTFIGHGCLVNLTLLSDELRKLEGLLGWHAGGLQSSLAISSQAVLITAEHRIADADGGVAGSTGQGISQAAQSRAARKAVRICDLFPGKHESSERTIYRLGRYHDASNIHVPDELTPRIDADGRRWLGNVAVYDSMDLLARNPGARNIIAEGAQGMMLDVDQGTWPNCTSTKTLTMAALDYRIRYHRLVVIGLAKAYWTYVGNAGMEGQFNKLFTYSGDYEFLRFVGNELGTTTGRRRQISALNLIDLIDAIAVDMVSVLVINKADVLPEAGRMYAALVEGKFSEYCAQHMDSWSPKQQTWAVGMIAYLAEHPEIAATYPKNMYKLVDLRDGAPAEICFENYDSMFAYIVAAVRARCPTVRKIVDYDSISGNVELVMVADMN